jgi:hypothetical protein
MSFDLLEFYFQNITYCKKYLLLIQESVADAELSESDHINKQFKKNYFYYKISDCRLYLLTWVCLFGYLKELHVFIRVFIQSFHKICFWFGKIFLKKSKIYK